MIHKLDNSELNEFIHDNTEHAFDVDSIDDVSQSYCSAIIYNPILQLITSIDDAIVATMIASLNDMKPIG